MTNINYLFGNKDNKNHRLDLLNAVYSPFSEQFLENVIQPSCKSILDIGSGQGFMAKWLAEKPSTESVLGIDIDAVALKVAENKQIAKAQFKLLSVYDLNQLSMQFDLIYERFVLIHLTNPTAALRAIYNQLKPGGLYVCDTGIHSHCFSDPKTESYDQFIKLAMQMFSSQGKDGDLGKSLASMASGLGFLIKKINLQQPILQNKTEKQLMLLGLKNSRDLFAQENLASKDELDDLEKRMQQDVANLKSIWAAPTVCQFVLQK